MKDSSLSRGIICTGKVIIVIMHTILDKIRYIKSFRENLFYLLRMSLGDKQKHIVGCSSFVWNNQRICIYIQTAIKTSMERFCNFSKNCVAKLLTFMTNFELPFMADFGLWPFRLYCLFLVVVISISAKTVVGKHLTLNKIFKKKTKTPKRTPPPQEIDQLN